MTTLEPTALRWLATQWETAIDTAARRSDAATFAGIVGDTRHRLEGGYHISREDQSSANYSVARFGDDRLGPSNLAAAVDMTMDTAAMRLVTGRLVTAWRRSDPRLDHVRALNGTLDGINAIRCDAANPDPNTLNTSSSDHCWHIHMELFRRWADDMNTMRDVLSVITGEAGPVVFTPQQEASLIQTSEYVNAWMDGRGATWDGKPIRIVQDMRALVAAVDAEKARDAAAATAVAGLKSAIEALAAALKSGGGSVDVAAILARVDQRSAEIRTAVEQQHAAEVAGLRAQLSAFTGGQ